VLAELQRVRRVVQLAQGEELAGTRARSVRAILCQTILTTPSGQKCTRSEASDGNPRRSKDSASSATHWSLWQSNRVQVSARRHVGCCRSISGTKPRRARRYYRRDARCHCDFQAQEPNAPTSVMYAVGVGKLRIAKKNPDACLGARTRLIRTSSMRAMQFYWRYVEFGTSKMKAQPFLRPALEAAKTRAIDQFSLTLSLGARSNASIAIDRQ
jgi:HK97 gp10 family phage protein